MSAEDQPQRPRILGGIRWNHRRPLRPMCCGWCSAHTAALREKSPRRRVVAEKLRGGCREKTSSMPRWGMARSAARPGAAPAARTCPRLISCGVPPGRRAKRWRQFLGFRPTAMTAAISSRAARILPGARRGARSPSRRRLAAGDVSDFNGCLRGFRGRCGWSSADTAALLGLRLRRAVLQLCKILGRYVFSAKGAAHTSLGQRPRSNASQ